MMIAAAFFGGCSFALYLLVAILDQPKPSTGAEIIAFPTKERRGRFLAGKK